MNYFIVDGNYCAIRAIFKGMNMTTSDGYPSGGSYIFLRMLHNFLEFGKPIVVFDGGHAKWREQLYPEYKNKPKDPNKVKDVGREEAFNATFTLLPELLPKMGIPTIRMAGEEADDVIFRLAKGLVDDGHHVTAISDDEDYLQMINYGVSVFRAMKGEHWNKDNFISYCGVNPEEFILYKSLQGDNSDNIAGIKGVGEAAALKIVKQLKSPTIESLIEWANSNDSSIAKKVKENISIAKRNLLLMDLSKCHITPDEAGLALAKAVVEAKPNFDYVKSKFQKMEFKTLGIWLDFVAKQ